MILTKRAVRCKQVAIQPVDYYLVLFIKIIQIVVQVAHMDQTVSRQYDQKFDCTIAPAYALRAKMDRLAAACQSAATSESHPVNSLSGLKIRPQPRNRYHKKALLCVGSA